MQPGIKADVRNVPVSHCTLSRLIFCQSINFNWTKSGWRRQKPLLQTANDIVTFSATSPTNSSFINVSYELANWGNIHFLLLRLFTKSKESTHFVFIRLCLVSSLGVFIGSDV